MKTHWQAILLSGPTGAGKTPLGNALETRNPWGHRCLHFDFGQQLRTVADSTGAAAHLDTADLAVVRRALHSGALLENETFHIAERILKHFLDDRQARQDDLVILNGLPRHRGQARDMRALVTFRLVVSLECSAAVVLQRLRSNIAGDRTGRIDDTPELVRRKLAFFNKRTLPLLAYLERACDAPVKRIPINATDTPEHVLNLLEGLRP